MADQLVDSVPSKRISPRESLETKKAVHSTLPPSNSEDRRAHFWLTDSYSTGPNLSANLIRCHRPSADQAQNEKRPKADAPEAPVHNHCKYVFIILCSPRPPAPKPQRKSSNELKLTFLWSVERGLSLPSVYCLALAQFGRVVVRLVSGVWQGIPREQGISWAKWSHAVGRWRVCKQDSAITRVCAPSYTSVRPHESEDGEEQKGGNVKLNAI